MGAESQAVPEPVPVGGNWLRDWRNIQLAGERKARLASAMQVKLDEMGCAALDAPAACLFSGSICSPCR